jgi:hypothetical protein
LCCLFFCLLAIVLFVLLRYTDSDYPFGIFKLFLLFSSMSVMHIWTLHKSYSALHATH